MSRFLGLQARELVVLHGVMGSRIKETHFFREVTDFGPIEGFRKEAGEWSLGSVTW